MKKLFKMILLLWIFSISSFAQDTWTVAGVSSIFGSEWTPTDTSNDMMTEDGVIYTLTKKDLSLSAGIVYEYKVVKNHSWDNESYGQDGGEPNKTFFVSQDGLYDLTITFNANTKELTELLIFIRSEDIWTVAGVSSVFGSEWDPTDMSNDMMSEDGVVFTLTKKDVNLSAGVVYEYKVVKNHSWDNESYGQDGGKPNKTFSVGLTGIYNLTSHLTSIRRKSMNNLVLRYGQRLGM